MVILVTEILSVMVQFLIACSAMIVVLGLQVLPEALRKQTEIIIIILILIWIVRETESGDFQDKNVLISFLTLLMLI